MCVYVTEFTGGQSKGVSRGLCQTLDLHILKLEIRQNKRRLILFLFISKCLGAGGEGEELGVLERAICTKGKPLHSPPSPGMLGFDTSEVVLVFFCQHTFCLIRSLSDF